MHDYNTDTHVIDIHDHTTIVVTYEMIAELNKKIAELESVISELKNDKTEFIASVGETQINPFMSDMTNTNQYSLLEKEDSRYGKYSLLEKY